MPITPEQARAELARRELARRAAARVAANGGTLAEQGWAATRAYRDVSPPRPARTAPRAAPPRRVGAGEDSARSAGAGLVQGGVNLNQSVARATGTPLPWMRGPGPQGAIIPEVLGAIARRMPEGEVGDTLRMLLDPVNEIPGANWSPQTTAGEWSRTAGQMAPNALMPGSAAARLASVFLPTAGSRAAGDTVEALGGDERAQAAAETAGAIVGGAAAGLRPKPTRAPRTPPRPAPPRPRSLAEETGPNSFRIRPAAKPDQRVAKAIREAMEADAQGGVPRAEVMARLAAGERPWSAAGPNVNALAEGAAQTRGPAMARLARSAQEEADALPGQFRSAVAQDTGAQGSAFATEAALKAARRKAADDVMARIGGEQVALTPGAVQALRSDLARSAIRTRAQNALASADDAERAMGAQLSRLADDVLDNPGAVRLDVRSIQDISRALRESGKAAFRRGEDGSALTGLARSLRDSARESSPGYRGWLKDYGDAMDLEAAAEAGRNVLTGKGGYRTDELAAMFDDWSDPARAQFRQGVGEALIDSMRSSRGEVGTLRNLLKDENIAARIRLAYPNQAAFARFMEDAQRALRTHGAAQRILHNSATARRNDILSPPTPVADAVEAVGNVTQPGTAVRSVARAMDSRTDIFRNPELNRLLGEALDDPARFRRLLDLTERTGNMAQLREAVRQVPELAAAVRRMPVEDQRRLLAGAVAAGALSPRERERPRRPAPPRR